MMVLVKENTQQINGGNLGCINGGKTHEEQSESLRYENTDTFVDLFARNTKPPLLTLGGKTKRRWQGSDL